MIGGLDHGVGHLVSMTTEKTHDSIQIGVRGGDFIQQAEQAQVGLVRELWA
jgi:hypothetical protein